MAMFTLDRTGIVPNRTRPDRTGIVPNRTRPDLTGIVPNRTGPDRNRSKPNRIGIVSKRTGPDELLFTCNRLEQIQVFTGDLFRTGPAPIQNWAWKTPGPFWSRSRPVPERCRVNRRPIQSDFRTGTIWIRLIWNRFRVNIAYNGLVSILRRKSVCNCRIQLRITFYHFVCGGNVNIVSGTVLKSRVRVL